jgi:hypothetical protein
VETEIREQGNSIRSFMILKRAAVDFPFASDRTIVKLRELLCRKLAVRHLLGGLMSVHQSYHWAG